MLWDGRPWSAACDDALRVQHAAARLDALRAPPSHRQPPALLPSLPSPACALCRASTTC